MSKSAQTAIRVKKRVIERGSPSGVTFDADGFE